MIKYTMLVVLAAVSFTVTGCVSVPQEKVTLAVDGKELSDHVHFLAQPALKGRKPKTWQSGIARRYIKNKFSECGLVPWPGNDGYERPFFGIGTNIIGILPGSDKDLAGEMVILCAHYDHVGKTKDGVCLGACDNASGVAALLEIAEQMSLSKEKPKRSICFACFDSEETYMLGSFVFTCREDFNDVNIAAVVNIDLLGRNAFDVIDRSLFVVGAESYPDLRSKILQCGNENDIKILPVGTDMVGPRGDHILFESMDIPALFFSCGLYKDYHKPSDTADKLDYAKMQRSVTVIADTVRSLADADKISEPIDNPPPDMDELKALAYIFEKTGIDCEESGLTKQQSESLKELADYAKELIGEKQYSDLDRQKFMQAIIENLPLAFISTEAIDSNDERSTYNMHLACMRQLYISHQEKLTTAYKDIVKELLRKPPGLFGKISIEYKSYLLDDTQMSFTQDPNGEYELYVLPLKLEICIKKNGLMLPEIGFNPGFGSEVLWCKGSKSEVIDFCLLQWAQCPDKSWGRAWDKVLKNITGDDMGGVYDNWLNWWMVEAGCSTEKERMEKLYRSDNPYLRTHFIRILDSNTPEWFRREFYQKIKDKKSKPAGRASGIKYLNSKVDQAGLLTLTEILDDTTAVERGSRCKIEILRNMGTLSDHLCMVSAIEYLEKRNKKKQTGKEDKKKQKNRPETFSDLAENKLKEITKKNFGKNKKAWVKWINSKYKK